MFRYIVSNEPSRKIFKSTCSLIESKISGLKKERLLVDVDGSLVQVYIHNDGKIIVYDDYDFYEVFVKSEIDLSHIITSL